MVRLWMREEDRVTRCAAHIKVEEERRKRTVKEDADGWNLEGSRRATEGRKQVSGKGQKLNVAMKSAMSWTSEGWQVERQVRSSGLRLHYRDYMGARGGQNEGP